jgi:hypothetical protein
MLTTFPPSYLYQQYADDVDLQALVTAFNIYAQEYLDSINSLNLPIYTKAPIVGPLLDWVALGVYGIPRPSASVSNSADSFVGAYNTAAYNVLPYNAYISTNPIIQAPVNDDVFRRVITWQFFKGDGTQFNIRWLKRRVMRFLYGDAGVDPGIDQTYPVSVSFIGPNHVLIRLVEWFASDISGSVYNKNAYNTVPYNSITATLKPNVVAPNAILLQQAIDAGILPLPFQYTYTVQIG